MANGYVRYGNSIHLDGFQILDFCIENAISLESLSDRNLGRKVFLTGNDTNAGYLRENVWDGDRWRAVAYLDDLTTFKDEDFNKLKEKVDTLIGDGVDMDGIIESWKEVEAFLAGMSDTKTLMTMLDGKLDTKGGIITGKTTIRTPDFGNQLCLDVTNGSFNVIRFQKNGTNMGFLGFNSSDEPIYADKQGQSSVLLHQGNYVNLIGSTYLKTDGSNAMTGDLQLLTMSSGPVNVAVTEGLFIYRGPSSGGTDAGLPDNYINVFNVGGTNAYSNLQLAWRREYPNPALYARIGESSGYSDWKTIAFTDSDITGNAATATKLKDKVSLWGNEFDGTQSLGGRIVFSKGFATMHVPIEDGGSNIEFLYVNQEGHLLLGQGLARNEKNTFIYGNNIKFCYGTLGTSANTAMTITEEGNVLIANPNNAYTRKLAVGVGGAHIISTTTGLPYLGTPANGSLLVGSVHYGLQIGTNTNDEASFIQAQRFNSADAKTLNLNPLGGEVKVGGNVRIANDYGLLSTTTSGSVVQMIGITKNNALFVGTDACIVNKMLISVFGSTIRFYTGASLEERVNTMTLTSSGHVLIGEAVDDADYALNVKGDSYFGGTVYIPTGQKLTIGSVTFEEDAAGRVKVDGDMYTTGTLASGGKAKEGTGTGSGSANVRDFELPADEKTTYHCDHLLKSKNVIVQVFEKALQNNIEVWEMILTDVTIVTEDRVTVTFGRPTTKVHKVHIIGGNVS